MKYEEVRVGDIVRVRYRGQYDAEVIDVAGGEVKVRIPALNEAVWVHASQLTLIGRCDDDE